MTRNREVDTLGVGLQFKNMIISIHSFGYEYNSMHECMNAKGARKNN